jgi:hypothetical protein
MGTAEMTPRLSFMDLSVDIKTLIVQHVSKGESVGGARLGDEELVGDKVPSEASMARATRRFGVRMAFPSFWQSD